jgi:hypothetical protein
MRQVNGDAENLSCGNDEQNLLSLSEFHKKYEVVFLDQSGFLNICSNMSECTFLKVKNEANLAIKFLNDQLVESFDVLFMKKMKFINSYDTVFRWVSRLGLSQAEFHHF